MPTAVFGSVVLNDPCRTITAQRMEEVLPVVEFAEAEARFGRYVIIMLAYEAAPVFDPALRTHAQNDFPLAWAASFAGTSEEESNGSFVSGPWTPQVSKDEYDSAVARIRELIAAGDTYQVNYSFPMTSSFNGDAYSWYRDLCVAQGAKYCAYLDLGRYRVLSLSPELFFERAGDHVTTRPMKGTVRRGRWPAEDEELACWLQNSTKDKAENIMIVDLLRNDLGKVSVTGSVHVSSLFQTERFETVWQMTSTVEATLGEGTSLVELISALFPCGSVTGAPKIRTMMIIRELEPFPRGAYTGAIGLIRPGGDCVFNVAIRTVVIDTESGVATFGVGGGVTIDSTAEKEYEECLVKSRFLRSKAVEFELFESILLEDGEFFLLDRHLERLRRSAAYFGFATDFATDFEKRLGSWKVKVTLSKDGRIETEMSPITKLTEPVRVALATDPVDSSDPFLFHKTTRREHFSHGSNLVFWNERGEITESSIANVVVRIGDQLFTPPVSSGLLAGTFREQLLAEGKIRERVITIEELKNAPEFFLINSVRRWMRAELVVEQDLRAGASKLLQ